MEILYFSNGNLKSIFSLVVSLLQLFKAQIEVSVLYCCLLCLYSHKTRCLLTQSIKMEKINEVVMQGTVPNIISVLIKENNINMRLINTNYGDSMQFKDG